jgi:UDP-N-acetylmuramoyl-tripeptide--D-alanyl-D-alanine ligase
MAELGQTSVNEHQSIIDEIKKHQWKEVLLVGGDFLKAQHSFRKFSSASEAGEWLTRQDIQGSQLLIKGSRSMGMEKILEYLQP